MKFAVQFIVALFFILYSLFFIAVNPAFAQTQSTSNQVLDDLFSNTDSTVSRDIGGITQVATLELLGTVHCFLVGINPVRPTQGCLGVNPQNGKLSYANSDQQIGGLFGQATRLIALTYTPPATGATYIDYLAANFGLKNKAYAQSPNGVGFAKIQPLFKLWEAFRNIAYLFFVIVFVLVGLAIMLRVKIDPRTVMTIENQIPKLVVGVILVTLTYPIAGFLIDMMYVITYLVMYILANADPTSQLPGALTEIQKTLNDPPIGVVQKAWQINSPLGTIDVGLFEMIRIPSASIGKIAGDLIAGAPFFGGFLQLLMSIVNPTAILCIIPPIDLGPLIPKLDFSINPACQIGPKNLGGLVSIFAAIILFIAIIWTLFRLWFQLIISYVFIILDIIFAPLWVLGGMFPGEHGFRFGGWMRDLIANLSAFPTALAMLLLVKIFMGYGNGVGATLQPGQLFVPPLIGNPNDPSLITSLIGLGILFLAPQVVNILKEILKAPQFKYLSAVGQPVAAGQSVVVGGGKSVGATTIQAVKGSAKVGEPEGGFAIVRRIFGS